MSKSKKQSSAPTSSYAKWSPKVDPIMQDALKDAATNFAAGQKGVSAFMPTDMWDRLKASKSISQNSDGGVTVGSNVDPLSGAKSNAFSGAGATADEIGLDTKNYLGQGLGDFIGEKYGKESYDPTQKTIKTAYGDIENPNYKDAASMPDKFRQVRTGGKNKHGIYEKQQYDYVTGEWKPIGRQEGYWQDIDIFGKRRG